MRKFTALLAAGLVLGVSGMAMAVSDTATSDVTATVVIPVTIANTAGLDFGKFAKPITGTATVIMSPASVRTGTADLIATTPGAAASFSLAGDTTLAYTATATYLTAVGTGLDLSALTATCGGTTNYAVGATGGTVSCALAGGVDTLTLGGTLTAGPTAVTATSTAHISLTVLYN